MSTAGQGKIEVSCAASSEKTPNVNRVLQSRNVAAPVVQGVNEYRPETRTEFVAEGVPVVSNEDPTSRPLHLDEEMKRLPLSVIVGRGCILPAGATSPEQLFQSVTEERIGLIDQRTLDPHWTEDFYSEKLVPDRSTSHLSGRVNDIDIVCPSGIDPEFFFSLTRTQKLFCIAMNPCLQGLREAERIVCLVGATADGFEDQDEATSLLFAGIDPLDCDVDRLMNSARSAHRTPHQAITYEHIGRLHQQLRPHHKRMAKINLSNSYFLL
jgi:hypothetical protein